MKQIALRSGKKGEVIPIVTSNGNLQGVLDVFVATLNHKCCTDTFKIGHVVTMVKCNRDVNDGESLNRKDIS